MAGGEIGAPSTATALAGGAGGFIGSILAKWLGNNHAHYLQEQVDRGGLLLWVRAWDADHEKHAVDILKRHSGSEVHVHGLPVTPAAASN